MDSETDMSDGEINQAGLSSLELWRMLQRGVQTAFGSDGALLPDDAMAYLFDTEEELVSLLRSILGEGAEGLLQARAIMLELQSRAERTIHCLHKRQALVPSEVKWLSIFNEAKRQCVVASGVVQTVPGLAACGALRRQGRYKTRRARGLARASGEESRQAVEAQELMRWRKELASLIVDAALPVVEPMALVRDRDAVLLGALGPARASTIRKHVREWRKARAFCLSVSGKPWPEHIGVVLDYLHERRLEPCARSVPAAFLAALSFIEKVGAVRRTERLSEASLLRNTVNQLTADLESKAPPKRQAPMLPLSIIGATELAVSDNSLPTYTRGFAFYKLLKRWTASRTNDLFGLSPDSLRLSEHGLQGTLDRTKCSGPGKRIRFFTYLHQPPRLRNEPKLAGGRLGHLAAREHGVSARCEAQLGRLCAHNSIEQRIPQPIACAYVDG